MVEKKRSGGKRKCGLRVCGLLIYTGTNDIKPPSKIFFFFFLVGLVPVPDLDGGAGWERLGLIED